MKTKIGILLLTIISSISLYSCDNYTIDDNEYGGEIVNKFDNRKCQIKSLTLGEEKIDISIDSIKNCDHAVIISLGSSNVSKELGCYFWKTKFSEAFPLIITAPDGEEIKIQKPDDFNGNLSYEQVFKNGMIATTDILQKKDSYQFLVVIYSYDKKLKIEYDIRVSDIDVEM